MARPSKISDDAVLDGAIELFWRNGADAVSIRDLERVLDLKAPSIYRRFESKDELLACSLDRYVDTQIHDRIRHLLDNAQDPLAGLRSFFTSVLRTHSGEPSPRGCLLTTTATMSVAASPRTQQAVQRGFDAIEAAFVRQVERCVTAGQLHAAIGVSAAAKSLMLSFQGLLVLARSGAPDLMATIDATFDILPQPLSNPS